MSAHRVAVAASLGLFVPVEVSDSEKVFNYKFFNRHRMNPEWMDYGALKFLEINPNAYIVNLHSVNELNKDKDVEGFSILMVYIL